LQKAGSAILFSLTPPLADFGHFDRFDFNHGQDQNETGREKASQQSTACYQQALVGAIHEQGETCTSRGETAIGEKQTAI